MSRISEMNPGVPAGAQRYLILCFMEFSAVSSLEPICLCCSGELASWENTQVKSNKERSTLMMTLGLWKKMDGLEMHYFAYQVLSSILSL